MDIRAAEISSILREQIKSDTHVMTDEAGQYCHTKEPMTADFERHSFVKHGIGEYVRGNVHTNTIESYFAIVKRGLNGTFHHVSPRHLKRYIGEFDFRYNNRKVKDSDTSINAILATKGKLCNQC